MKKITLFLLFLTLTSCFIEDPFREPDRLSLSGEYVIDRITYSNIENSVNYGHTILQPGSVYSNPNENLPMNYIEVGFTRWHLDYSVISFNPTTLPSGQVMWGDQFFYRVINYYSIYDLGYIDITMDGGGRRLFKIIDDGMESLTLRTTGRWIGSSYNPNESITLHLTRIGP
jgi:hypothetical protein